MAALLEEKLESLRVTFSRRVTKFHGVEGCTVLRHLYSLVDKLVG